jgi:ring-1,2-phenylacetyl-CoA epoxidase subunit PaaC
VNDLFVYTLRLGDDALIAAQRTAEWIAAAPQLEEDVALGNIGLDQLGQARSLLQYAGQVEGAGRSEDDLAYFRDERDFLNVQLCELPNGDFAQSIAKLLYFATYQHLLYEELRGCADETLAGVAGKAVKEVAYHVDHATQWVLRLGDGTEESHRRMQRALDGLWRYTGELFDPLEGLGVDLPALHGPWLAGVSDIARRATLAIPQGPDRTAWSAGAGRQGVHTEPFGLLLAEMQYLHRAHPGASW